MMPTVKDILDYLCKRAPTDLALDFDNVGLLVGRQNREVANVLTALDITDEVIEEAIALKAELIVSHHPLFFQLKGVTDREWTQNRALTLAENHIAAICMHTNLDAADGGVNDVLMTTLGGTVTGELGDDRIGRVGVLNAPVHMSEFLPHVKAALNGNGLRYHDAGKPVYKLAVCGGSGGGEIELAHARGCDTYVTADVKYDPFLLAKHLGMNLIDADHFCTENLVIPILKSWLEQAFPMLNVQISQVHGQTAQFF